MIIMMIIMIMMINYDSRRMWSVGGSLRMIMMIIMIMMINYDSRYMWSVGGSRRMTGSCTPRCPRTLTSGRPSSGSAPAGL